MATPIQRATGIITALLDEAPTGDQLQKIGDAYAFTYRRGETLTGAEKATVFLQETRRHIKQIVADAIRSQASAAATAAADSDVELGVDDE